MHDVINFSLSRFLGAWPGVLGGVCWRGTIQINNHESWLHNHSITHHPIRSGRATHFNLNLMSNSSLFYFQWISSLSLIHYHSSFHYSTSKVSSDSDSDSDSLSIHLFIYLSGYQSLCLSIYQSLCVCIYLSINISLYLCNQN